MANGNFIKLKYKVYFGACLLISACVQMAMAKEDLSALIDESAHEKAQLATEIHKQMGEKEALLDRSGKKTKLETPKAIHEEISEEVVENVVVPSRGVIANSGTKSFKKDLRRTEKESGHRLSEEVQQAN